MTAEITRAVILFIAICLAETGSVISLPAVAIMLFAPCPE